jgi:TIR domain
MDEQTALTSHGPDVMVSYSSQDRAQVMQFVQKLRAAGVAAWIDQGGIDGAQKWGEEIVNAIDACKTVILMISQASMRSENIAREVMLAWENGKHFLPLCLEDAPIPKSMQYQLAGIQKIMLFQGDPEAKFVAVLRALVRLGVHVSPYSIALVSADLGEREQAVEWLNKAIEQRSGGLAKLKTEARFNLLRGDPRFADILKRAESIPIDLQEDSAMIPAFLPRPVVVRPAEAAGPVPLWKRIAWPDIFDDRSARQAAAQGVWAAGFLVVTSLLMSFFATAPPPGTVPGLGWTNPLLIALIYAPIAFGIQKMGRPAAIIALSLCTLGALGNLTAVQATGTALDAARAAQMPYQNQYQNPYLAQLEAQSHYYWFALLFSLLCVGAFTNATRGTLGYRRLVAAREARDKQDAISREDWAAIKAKFTGLKSRSAGAPTHVATASASPQRAPTLRDEPRVNVAAAPVQPAVIPAQAVVAPEPAEKPVVHDATAVAAPVRQAFAPMIGVSAGLIYWPRVAALLTANLAAGLVFLLGRSLTTSVPPVYWLFAIGTACVLTAATVAGFRLLRNPLAAAAAAAGMVALITLPLYSLLPTFAWADLGYREQFQQFVLLPFVSSFVLLAALVWVVPRLQPLVLALWLGAMGTEIVTSLVANLLHALGAGDPPDAVLGGASVISALLRSLAFALALWSGLEYSKKKAGSAAA